MILIGRGLDLGRREARERGRREAKGTETEEARADEAEGNGADRGPVPEPGAKAN